MALSYLFSLQDRDSFPHSLKKVTPSSLKWFILIKEILQQAWEVRRQPEYKI